MGSGPENPGRERILSRIRAALTETAPKHVPHPGAQPIFTPISDPLERYQKECLANKTECLVVPDARESAAIVATVLASIPEGEIFIQESSSLRTMAARWDLNRPIRWSSEGKPAEATQATITLAEVLVAQTGSVFISSSCGGRGASIVAPVHIVVAGLSQLVPDLSEAFAWLHRTGALERNSFVGLTTGSSRTADIEKILVLGAHGPRRMIVVLSLND